MLGMSVSSPLSKSSIAGETAPSTDIVQPSQPPEVIHRTDAWAAGTTPASWAPGSSEDRRTPEEFRQGTSIAKASVRALPFLSVVPLPDRRSHGPPGQIAGRQEASIFARGRDQPVVLSALRYKLDTTRCTVSRGGSTRAMASDHVDRAAAAVDARDLHRPRSSVQPERPSPPCLFGSVSPRRAQRVFRLFSVSGCPQGA